MLDGNEGAREEDIPCSMCWMGMREDWTRDTTMGEGRTPGGGRMVRESCCCCACVADPPDPPGQRYITTISCDFVLAIDVYICK